MKMPWSNKTGLAKAAVFFACVLGVSFGLCGANLVGYMALSRKMGGLKGGIDLMLVSAGYLELAGMVFGLLGLVITGLIGMAMAIYGLFVKGGGE